MFRTKFNSNLLKNMNPLATLSRSIQVSIVGATNEVASHVAMFLKHSDHISQLNLFDDDERVHGLASELNQIPGRANVQTFMGDVNLPSALDSSKLILMLQNTVNRRGNTAEQNVAINSLSIKRLCKAMTNRNSNAFLAVSTGPVNSTIPLISTLLFKNGGYNPQKVFGITNVDSARSRSVAAQTLKVNPDLLKIPVIGGHSKDTVVPLFSNICPTHLSIECSQANMLTSMVRKAEEEVVCKKNNGQPDTLAMAWSISEFVDGIVKAMLGEVLILNCYTANPHFGTRYFAGPCIVGPDGIQSTCKELSLSDLESTLLAKALPIIYDDVALGESFGRSGLEPTRF